ncbi:MAG: prolipoprotein diacylglyceryl transferase [Patescibacteria group bacterium]
MIQFIPFLAIPIGPFSIATHGVFFSIGILVAFLLARRAAKKAGLNLNVIDDMIVVCVLAGLIGARIAFVAVLGQDMSFVQMLKVWEGGLSSHGGYIAAILAGVIYIRHKKLDVITYADVLLPYLLVGWAIGRIGCLNAIGEWGWALSDPSPLAFNIYGVARYPTSLFETLAYLIGFGLIWLVRKYTAWGKMPGVAAGLTIFLFTLSRFLIDFLREYDRAYLVFTQSVTGALALAALGFMIFRVCKRRKS